MKNNWLGNRKAVAGSEEWIGFLDKEAKLEGTLELAGMFRIDCEFRGVVKSQDHLIVAENARIQGDVEGEVISVAGRITGDIHAARSVEIVPSGVVEGDIHTPSLVIQPGGVLEGRCHMRGVTELSVPGPERAKSVPALASEEAAG